VSAYLGEMIASFDFWMAVGVMGQLVFMSRMLVQWYASERQKESVVPVSFWWISIIGSVVVLAYGIKKMQPPVILGQLFGFVVYIRNLMLIYAKRAEAGVAGATGTAVGEAAEAGTPGTMSSAAGQGARGTDEQAAMTPATAMPRLDGVVGPEAGDEAAVAAPKSGPGAGHLK